MNKKIALSTAGAALLAALFWIQWIPAGSIGVAGEGDGAKVFPAGLRLRSPFSPYPVLYPLRIGPVRGEAPLRASDGQLYQVAFAVSGRLDPARVLDFHGKAAEHGVEKVMRMAASHAIGIAAGSLDPATIAGGGLGGPAQGNASTLLDQVGVVDVGLEVSIDSPPTLLRLARSLAPDGRAGLIKEAAESALAADPSSWETITALGLALESERDFHGAESRYLDALALNPTALEPMAQLVRIYTAVGEADKLERLLGAALQVSPGSLQHLNWLAASFMQRGLLDRAEEIYHKALEVDARSTVILNNLGGVYLKQNRPDDAIALFRRAVEARPDDRQSLYNLGVALCSQGEYKEGLEHLLDADRVAPGTEPILAAIARAEKALGRRAEAESWERRAREAQIGGGDP